MASSFPQHPISIIITRHSLYVVCSGIYSISHITHYVCRRLCQTMPLLIEHFKQQRVSAAAAGGATMPNYVEWSKRRII